MPLDPHRLLGFAFAAADLLVEVGGDGRITLAVGASDLMTGGGEGALMGNPWQGFIDPRDVPLMQAMFDGLEGASRKGPVTVRQKKVEGRPAAAFALSACKLPQNGASISCALAHANADNLPEGPGGLHDRGTFEAVTQTMIREAKAKGLELEMAFLDMPGLIEARKGLSAEKAEALEMRLGGALRAQSHGGGAAAILSDERYALVRKTGETSEALSAQIAKLISSETGANIMPNARAFTMDGDASGGQVVRAIRFALDDFIKDGMAAGTPASLSDAVAKQVEKTLAKADALSATVKNRDFRLIYQPVVALSDGSAHHFEVLVRFGDNGSPFPMIRMAEELDMIEDLDLAVAEQAIAVMAKFKNARLAVNISGRTIITDSFMTRITSMIDAAPHCRGRLMFEVTESAAIEDLALADRHIQVLRQRKCHVCLDDFGAGAASLAYLQQLALDVVKLDGRYVRDLQHGGREAAFIKHLVNMCRELQVETLAEMVETREAEEAIRKAGVDYGQGWLYGAGTDTPIYAPPKPALPAAAGPSPAALSSVRAAARRKGAVETWG